VLLTWGKVAKNLAISALFKNTAIVGKSPIEQKFAQSGRSTLEEKCLIKKTLLLYTKK
jgi:hypothetical protein